MRFRLRKSDMVRRGLAKRKYGIGKLRLTNNGRRALSNKLWDKITRAYRESVWLDYPTQHRLARAQVEAAVRASTPGHAIVESARDFFNEQYEFARAERLKFDQAIRACDKWEVYSRRNPSVYPKLDPKIVTRLRYLANLQHRMETSSLRNRNAWQFMLAPSMEGRLSQGDYDTLKRILKRHFGKNKNTHS